MQKFYSAASIIILLFILGCHTDNGSLEITKANVLSPSTAQQIPLEMAERWISSHLKKQPAGRSATESSYQVSSFQFEKAWKAIANPLGLAFHHALDNNGVYHILVFALDKDAALWKSSVIIDANTDSSVKLSEAQAWTKNYEKSNPGGIWYYVFGAEVVNEIGANSNFNYIDIKQAINDEQKPQLVLLAWNNKKQDASGKSKQELVVAYDFASPCPPCIPTTL